MMHVATSGDQLLTLDAVEKAYRRGPVLVRALQTINLSLHRGQSGRSQLQAAG